VAESNLEIARRGYAAVLAGDLDAVRDFLDPDVKWHGGDPDGDGACRNRDQALSVIRHAIDQGGVGELVDVVDAGDQVVVILRPFPDSGPVANLTTFRHGRAIEMVHYADPAAALAAVGRSSI
jgi:ketosteroid isomerase-like protein